MTWVAEARRNGGFPLCVAISLESDAHSNRGDSRWLGIIHPQERGNVTQGDTLVGPVVQGYSRQGIGVPGCEWDTDSGGDAQEQDLQKLTDGPHAGNRRYCRNIEQDPVGLVL